uniref:Uncharacterized protein n=1 Tax=Knipowitschia caucasica TaxID=637954 RepID=A0AAV2L2K2_KNICA
MDEERPGPSRLNYEARIQRLEARLTTIERSHAMLEKKCRSLQVASARVAPTSAQKGEHVDKLRNPDLLDGKPKDIHNAKQSASHSLRFCRYMAQGVPVDTLRSLRFLNRMDHLRGYPTYLAQKGYKSTTVKNMLTNVIMFLRQVGKRFPRKTRLRPAEATNIEYKLQRIQRDIQREVLIHRQKVLKKKSADQLDASQCVTFLGRAKTAICEILGREDPEEVHGLGMGYILCYLAILTGHRAVVFTNTTKESVENADSWKSGTRFQVLASILLDRQEFDWLRLLATGSFCKEECSGANFLFHSSSGAQLKHGSELINRAWSAAGLKGTITFNKVRSSVATQANDQLTEKERRRVARAMCHDPATASKFYVALPNGERQYQDRLLRMKALCLASNTRPDRHTRPAVSSSSESEGPEPVYQDSPDSSGSELASPEPDPSSPVDDPSSPEPDRSNPEQEPEPEPEPEAEVELLSPEYEPLTPPPQPSTADRQPWTPVWDVSSPVPASRKRRRMLFPADEEDEEPRALPEDMPRIKQYKVDVDRLPRGFLLYYATVKRDYPV